MLRFQNPEFLYLCLLVPVIYFSYQWVKSNQKKKREQKLGKKMYPILSASISVTASVWKMRLESLALICLIIALARPQLGIGEKEVSSTGIELMFAVDVSRSMLAEDVKPSRLDFLKRELGLLLDELSGDKVGLVVFAGSSALVSPLTSDYSALKMFIDGLSPESVSSQGTIFASAISESMDAFERGGVESDDSTTVSKVLLIASDGEDNEEGALAMAKKAKEQGLRIYSMSFGTDKGGSIPIRDGNGYLKGYKQNSQGNIVVTKTKTKLLRELSEAGGGRHYHAVVGGAHIKALVNDFNNLEKAEFSSTVAKDFNEYFQWFLSLGFGLLFLERLLSSRKKLGSRWKGRFDPSEESFK